MNLILIECHTHSQVIEGYYIRLLHTFSKSHSIVPGFIRRIITKFLFLSLCLTSSCKVSAIEPPTAHSMLGLRPDKAVVSLEKVGGGFIYVHGREFLIELSTLKL